MSVVHFKMKASKQWESVAFEGQVISVLELKRMIVQQKKLDKKKDFDLLLTNKQTGERYRDDGLLVPKNTSIEVRRVPATRARTIKISQAPTVKAVKMDINGNPEEDAAVASIMQQAGQSSSNPDSEYRTGRGGGGGGGGFFGYRGYNSQPPPGYVCHRCNKPGHWIKQCPTNGDPNFDFKRPKPSTGIPRAFLKEVDPEMAKNAAGGTVMLPGGKVAVAVSNDLAFREALGHDGTLDRVRRQQAAPKAQKERMDLVCPLCDDYFRDAVVTPCCFTTYCNECVRRALVSTGDLLCPSCKQPLKPEDLMPNRSKQDAVEQFLRSKNMSSSSRRGGGSSGGGSDSGSRPPRGYPSGNSSRSHYDNRHPSRSGPDRSHGGGPPPSSSAAAAAAPAPRGAPPPSSVPSSSSSSSHSEPVRGSSAAASHSRGGYDQKRDNPPVPRVSDVSSDKHNNANTSSSSSSSTSNPAQPADRGGRRDAPPHSSSRGPDSKGASGAVCQKCGSIGHSTQECVLGQPQRRDARGGPPARGPPMRYPPSHNPQHPAPAHLPPQARGRGQGAPLLPPGGPMGAYPPMMGRGPPPMGMPPRGAPPPHLGPGPMAPHMHPGGMGPRYGGPPPPMSEEQFRRAQRGYDHSSGRGGRTYDEPRHHRGSRREHHRRSRSRSRSRSRHRDGGHRGSSHHARSRSPYDRRGRSSPRRYGGGGHGHRGDRRPRDSRDYRRRDW